MTAFVDANLTVTVIRNLVSNAIKFTHEGGEIVISAREGDDVVELWVADNGVGVSEEDMAKLFRQDTRHSTVGTARESGTGLGLLMCKELVAKNDGRIWAESELGTGSTFKIALPARRPS